MATWPTTLPAPLFAGYAVKPIDPTIRTDMEFGAARTRRRTSARNDTVTAFWLFNATQMAAFRAWFEDPAQAAGGAAWFDMQVNLGDTNQSNACRFSGGFEMALVGHGTWQVSAKLEIR